MKDPDGQLANHAVEAGKENCPEGTASQELDDLAGWYVPAGQGTWEAEPSEST